jgi:PAS domain S-box-containing protein
VNSETSSSQVQTNEILDHIAQAVIKIDLNGNIAYWNDASENIFGYSKEEMLNKPVSKIYPLVETSRFRKMLDQLRKGSPINAQWKSITKAGAEIWVDVHAQPLQNSDGKTKAVIASAHNIQHLKKVEEELKENKAKAHAILETTADGILTIDEAGKIVGFNKAASKIFAYTEEEAVGKNIRMLMADPYGLRRGEYFRNFMESGKTNIIGKRREMAGQRKDGSIFPMELSISEIQLNGKRIFTAIIKDISDRRRLEQEILRISEEERRSLGQDLHDGLGQMLTGISLISENLARNMASKGIADADKVQEIADLIKEADEYAKTLAHGLVQMDFEQETLDTILYQLCSRVERLFNIKCSFMFDADIVINKPLIATQLYRITQEAISNAVKHGKADNINISLLSDNGVTKLSIEDNGAGFSGSEATTKKKGMGIQIMKYRANLLSGDLDIYETEDKKTKVVCSIPQEPLKTDGE